MTTEQRMLRRTTRRIIPFLIVCYFIAFLDRINVGVAALEMNRDIGLTATMFGLGAGLFFLTYFLFEVPSNVLMQRVGARRWIARIMLTWGLVSGATAFVQDATGFYVVRLLLGAAEAGFVPAVLLYISLWFPQAHRARVFGYFFAALPLAGLVGSPLSGLIMTSMDGVMGFQGWQWLFVLEALPAVLLAPVAYFYLTDRPEDATWLPDDERELLCRQLREDAAVSGRRSRPGSWVNLKDWRVAALAVIHLSGNLAIYGLAFFLPQIVQTMGVTNFAASSIAALPYIAGAIGMLYFGRRVASGTGDPRLVMALPFLISAVGFAIASLIDQPVVLLAAICVAAFGVFGYAPGFWSTPTAFLTGGALAIAIAVINSIGNLGGFLGPYSIGHLREASGSYLLGLFVSAALMAVSAVLSVVLATASRSSTGPATAEATPEADTAGGPR